MRHTNSDKLWSSMWDSLQTLMRYCSGLPIFISWIKRPFKDLKRNFKGHPFECFSALYQVWFMEFPVEPQFSALHPRNDRLITVQYQINIVASVWSSLLRLFKTPFLNNNFPLFNGSTTNYLERFQKHNILVPLATFTFLGRSKFNYVRLCL